MEPSTNPQPSFELPQPQSLEASAPSTANEAAPAAPSPERQSGSAEGPGSTAQPQVAQPIPFAPPMTQPPAAAPVPAAQPVGVNAPAAASDVDLIEREWVDKAKAIVERTRSDPHVQNDEINKFKADYMKKRYNKDMKVTE